MRQNLMIRNTRLFLLFASLYVCLLGCVTKNYTVNQFYCDSMFPQRDTSVFFHVATSNNSVYENIKYEDSTEDYTSSIWLSGLNQGFSVTKKDRYLLYYEKNTRLERIEYNIYMIYSWLTKDTVKYGFAIDGVNYYMIEQNGGFGGVSIHYKRDNVPEKIRIEPFYIVNGKIKMGPAKASIIKGEFKDDGN